MVWVVTVFVLFFFILRALCVCVCEGQKVGGHCLVLGLHFSLYNLVILLWSLVLEQGRCCDWLYIGFISWPILGQHHTKIRPTFHQQQTDIGLISIGQRHIDIVLISGHCSMPGELG